MYVDDIGMAGKKGNMTPMWKNLTKQLHFLTTNVWGALKESVVSCVFFGGRTCVPIRWMCKKQTSVSHSSTESEIISLDAGLRMDGLPALDLWDVVIGVLRSSNSTNIPTNPAEGNSSRNHKSKPKQKGNRDVEQLSHVYHVATNAHSSQVESQLYIFEDNEAVTEMIIDGRSPTMRHISRTHRVA